MMAVQYETKATNVGGRKGHVHTDDNACLLYTSDAADDIL